MFNKLKKFLRSKRALANVSTAIKVGTSVVLGALLLVGSYGIIKTTVLPKANHKVSDMYNQEYADSNGTWSSPDSIEELKAKYNFKYYSTLELAIADVNASTPGANADALELVAEAGLYEKEDGTSCVVLLKDANKTSTITLSNDIELNLGGRKLNFTGVQYYGLNGGTNEHSFFVNGRLQGSEINISGTTGGNAAAVCCSYGTWMISGGTYKTFGSGNVFGILSNTNLNISNCSIVVEGDSSTNNPYVWGIYGSGASTVNVENCSVGVWGSSSGSIRGVICYNDSNIKNCSVKVSGVSKVLTGICNPGTSYMEDCNISVKPAVEEVESGSEVAGVYLYSNQKIKNCTITASIIKSKPKYSGGTPINGSLVTGVALYSGSVKTEVENCDIKVSAGQFVDVQGITFQGDSSNIKGCTVSASGINKTYAIAWISTGKSVKIIDCNVSSTSKIGHAYGIGVGAGGSADISGCTVNAYSERNALGLIVDGDSTNATAKDSTFNAYSDFAMSGQTYAYFSIGVYQAGGTVTLKNCKAYGTHSGVQVLPGATLNIDGGTYSGYSHGGLYVYSRTTPCHIKNATFKEAPMPKGYTNINGDFNAAGAYLLSSTSVYVDNCNFEASQNAIVLKEYNYEDSRLYISNSTLNKKRIRIDNGQKVYIGVGNNFTASDTSNASACEVTSETYS